MKKTNKRISDERHVRKLIFATVTKILLHKRSGLKFRPAIRIFCKFQKLEIKGNAVDFIVDLYNSNTNKYIRRGGYEVVGISKKITHKLKGGIPSIKLKEKKSYTKFLRGSYWRYVRQIVLKRDNSKCAQCDSTIELQIHHKSYLNHFREHENLQDLITLCKLCHEKEHNITTQA